MSMTFLRRGVLALAVVAAAVCAVGIGATSADAQTPAIDTHGPYTGDVGGVFPFVATSNVESIASARWDFSDGTSMTGASVNKTFRYAGTFTATVTVTTTSGQTLSASTTAHVSPLIAVTPLVFPQQLAAPVVVRPVVSGFVGVVGPIVTPIVTTVATPVVINHARLCTVPRFVVNGVGYC